MIKFSLNKILITLIILLPFTTAIQGLSMFSSVNKISIALIGLLLVCSVVSGKTTKGALACFALIAALTLLMILLDDTVLGGSYRNNYYYFPLWGLLFLYLSRHFQSVVDYFWENQQAVLTVCILWSVLFIVALFFPGAYSQKWGGGTYFAAFTGSEHRFASSCFLIMLFGWLLVQMRRQLKYYFIVFLGLVGTFLCGARTYLGVAIVLLVCIFYSHFKEKAYFYLSMPFLMLALVFFVFATPIGDKVIVSLTDNTRGGFWYNFTSGRNEVWALDIQYFFFQAPWYKKLVGSGALFAYKLHPAYGYGLVWAHNDFVQHLLSNGLLGLGVYVGVFLNFSNTLIRKQRSKGEAVWLPIVCYYFIWIFNACFNGVYTYLCATFAMPFLAYALFFQESTAERAKKTLAVSARPITSRPNRMGQTLR